MEVYTTWRVRLNFYRFKFVWKTPLTFDIIPNTWIPLEILQDLLTYYIIENLKLKKKFF